MEHLCHSAFLVKYFQSLQRFALRSSKVHLAIIDPLFSQSIESAPCYLEQAHVQFEVVFRPVDPGEVLRVR